MFSKAVVAASLLAVANAHQNWHQFWVNGVTPGYQVGLRMPPSNSPVTNVTSNAIACNVNGDIVPSGVDSIAANEGDTIEVQWDSSGHPGPITHFLYGPVDNASLASGVGAGWFKIAELDYVNGTWANAIMEAADMTYNFTLPTSLTSGDYLLRGEMEALHGSNEIDGAQFYIGCAQLTITGTGGSCGPTISLPGDYNAADSNIYIPDVYYGFNASTFTAPGGAVATCTAGTQSSPVPTITVTASTDENAVAVTPSTLASETSTAATTTSAAAVATTTSAAVSTSSAVVASSTSVASSSAVVSSATSVAAVASSSASASVVPSASYTNATSIAASSTSATLSTTALDITTAAAATSTAATSVSASSVSSESASISSALSSATALIPSSVLTSAAPTATVTTSSGTTVSTAGMTMAELLDLVKQILLQLFSSTSTSTKRSLERRHARDVRA